MDVGIFTNRLDEMRAFYGERVGLPFEELLPVGSGARQYRYGLLGSVLKINHSRDPLPETTRGGYARITIADPRTPMALRLADPDGNQIELVPRGHFGVDQIDIHLEVSNEEEFDRFYADALGGAKIAPRRYRFGKTILSFAPAAEARRAERSAQKSAADALLAMRAVGIRYITLQVRDCNAEFKRLTSIGVQAGSPPVTLGDIARICFIRDPDGNWIEISQRASLTGPLPKD